MNDTLAIVVTYNRKLLLAECLTALKNVSCDVLVVDNASTDGTRDIIKGFDVKYFNTGTNLGGAGGYNVGLREACKYDYKYFWLMDDDCIVNANSLDKLLEADKNLNGNWAFLSSKVLWTDGSICKTNVQRKAVARRIKDFTTPLVNVDYASFVSLLIKKEDVLKIGLPIKDFFIWTDDLEYTRRLTMNCGKGYLVNDSVVTHKCKENIGVDISKDTNDRLDRYKYIYRNDVYTFKKEGISGSLYLVARYLYHVLKIFFRNTNNKILKFKIMNQGYIEGLKYKPSVDLV